MGTSNQSPPDGEGLLALQGQVTELREQLAQAQAAIEKLTDPASSLGARVAAAERGVCLAAAIVGELYSSSVKSDIVGLVDELKKLVKPMNEAFEKAAAQEVAHAG